MRQYQRRGIGGSALRELFKHFPGKVVLEVNVNNFSALKFYEQNNFKILRKIKKFYENGDDAFFMLYDGKATQNIDF